MIDNKGGRERERTVNTNPRMLETTRERVRDVHLNVSIWLVPSANERELSYHADTISLCPNVLAL